MIYSSKFCLYFPTFGQLLELPHKTCNKIINQCLHRKTSRSFDRDCVESLDGFEEFSSVQFSRSVVSDSLRPHESQHARPPCPSPAPGVYSDSRPSSRWCHPAISSSVVPFSSCPQSLPPHEKI